MKNHLLAYLNHLSETYRRGDAREESYYIHLDELLHAFAEFRNITTIDVTILPKKTEAGNPDFRIWDGRNHVTGYIEAKDPSITNLDTVESSAQLQRYMQTFPNVILTNFYEFRLYRDGEKIAQALIARPQLARKLQTAPPLENLEPFIELFDRFFSFSVPKVFSAKSLATELAKRTRFLRDEVVSVELQENGSKGHRQVIGFYEAFQKYLIHSLSKTDFADLYSQTITYGLFAARSRVPADQKEFNRRMAFDYIPQTIGILRDIFEFISIGNPPKSFQLIIDDIAEVLQASDLDKIIGEYQEEGKGRDPIIHFYETFLKTYDPALQKILGVYYTPESVVKFIVRAVHELLKSSFQIPDGLAGNEVKLLDPAGGTLSFPAEAIRVASEEYVNKYGHGSLAQWIQSHILKNFYAFELMMAPYAVGHLKINFLLRELGYKMKDDERFQLYLTNTLEMEDMEQVYIPGLSALSEESHLAGHVKKDDAILVIIGNPPYRENSSTQNKWTELLLKTDMNSAQNYYSVDGKALTERNPKSLQNDYIKFIRLAQWKIHKAGRGIVAMITSHSYINNIMANGMRQSLLKTFDLIYIIDLHGNSITQEKAPDGSKDVSVFDIRQGTAIAIFVKNPRISKKHVFHTETFGSRQEKFNFLDQHSLVNAPFQEIKPQTPWYFFQPWPGNQPVYLSWPSLPKIFPVHSSAIKTHRDAFVVQFDKKTLTNNIRMFRNKFFPDDLIAETFGLKDNRDWLLSESRKKAMKDTHWENNIKKTLYRPFDYRMLYYSDYLIDWPRNEVMQHMEKDNIALIATRGNRQISTGYFFISDKLTDVHILDTAKDSTYQFPLYLYTDKPKKKKSNPMATFMLFEPQESYGRKPNIAPAIFDKLTASYQRKPSPEEILHYIYGIFYSTIFRETYADFLKIDFPRVPFTTELALFEKMAALGEKLAQLHLMQSPLLEHPIAKYQGEGDNDRVENIRYDETLQRVYINKDKYFEGVTPELWNVYIGGYQVLHKYLKDRKGRPMDDAPHYTRIVTALHHTKLLQNESDELYTAIESQPILSWEA
jgi:hypothetical protein